MTAPVVEDTATALCTSFIGARRLRATRLDGCGRPVYGPRSQVVSSGFVSVEIGPEVEEGDDYTQKTAGGEICVADKGQDNIKWFTVSIEFCRVDPDLFLVMNPSWKPVLAGNGSTMAGWRIGQKLDDTKGFALELWPRVSGGNSGAACLLDEDQTTNPDDPEELSGYFLLPYLVGQAPESWTLENGTATFTLNGRTKAGSLWGRGPANSAYRITRDATGARSLLNAPIDPGFAWPSQGITTASEDPDFFHAEVVTVPPPDPSCGARPLWNEDATVALLDATSTDRTATADVTNLVDVGGAGTLHWGDGTTTAVTSTADLPADHTYDASYDGREVSIEFRAANSSVPATATITPTAPVA